MKLSGRKVMLCNCEQTMTLDGKSIAKALDGAAVPEIHSNLCRMEIQKYATALQKGEPILLACTQEAPLFRELAADAKSDTPLQFVNIRENAGWSQSRGNIQAKITALLAEAVLESRPTGFTTLQSDGMCLVYGSGQAALDAAEQLATRLNVTLLLSDAENVIPPSTINVPIYKGTIVSATGHLGAFEVTIDNYAPVMASSKNGLEFLMAKDGATTDCSLILDMSGGNPILSGHKHRDGYLFVDPRHPVGIQKALFDISDLVGEFEKPLYVDYDADICAHSRNGQTGCSNCLDTCPASAITPNEDYILVDTGICGGCGTCSAVCPSGAISYAYPRREDLIRRAQTLLSTYMKAGGTEPILLVHDQTHGAEMIAAMARFGRGLPAGALPLAVNSVTQVGHDLLASALAAGATQIFILCPPERRDEIAPLTEQSKLIEAMLSGLGFEAARRVQLLEAQDPDIIETALWDCDATPLVKQTSKSASEISALFEPIGGKRAIARTAFSKLHALSPGKSDIIALPDHAPYGRVIIDTEGCTLCLSCVSCCPADALIDNPDKPQISFVESACLQCGLCVTTCPENVMTLEPRFNFSPSALSPETLYEDEPADCVRCGKPFGSKGTIARISAQLAGKHSMFMSGERAEMIKMCDDCRVIIQTQTSPDPMTEGTIPTPRTTEEYLEAEQTLRDDANGKTPSNANLKARDFLKDEG